jgi:TonB-dependent starch-binding outer membrane protein SusC
MKLTILLLTVSVLSVFAVDSYSQTTKLTLNLEKSTIRNVLNEIENKSEFKFWYSGDINVENDICFTE